MVNRNQFISYVSSLYNRIADTLARARPRGNRGADGTKFEHFESTQNFGYGTPIRQAEYNCSTQSTR